MDNSINMGDPQISPSSIPHETWLLAQLKASARSFYLTLRFLPSSVRHPIGLAYLLARIADTLADHMAWKPHKRLSYMHAYRAYILGEGNTFQLESQDIDQLSNQDQQIVANIQMAHTLLQQIDPADAGKVKKVVSTLTSGMVEDLEYFSDDKGVTALKTEDDLDRYTYLVAGCVGEFWTDICIQHLPTLTHWNREIQVKRGINFGKALQLTNILRDIPSDHQIQRCYIPEELLRRASSNPEKIVSSLSDEEIAILLHILKTCVDHYQDAIDYTMAIPSSQYRLRLACTLPILIGLKTISQLHANIQTNRKVEATKISRNEVYRILLSSILSARWDGLLRSKFKRAIAFTKALK